MRLAGRAQEPSREFGECLNKMGPMWLSLALLFHLIESGDAAPAVQVPLRSPAASTGWCGVLHSARRALLRPARRLRGAAEGALGRNRDPALPEGRDCAARHGASLSRHAWHGARRADQDDAAVETSGWLTRTRPAWRRPSPLAAGRGTGRAVRGRGQARGGGEGRRPEGDQVGQDGRG